MLGWSRPIPTGVPRKEINLTLSYRSTTHYFLGLAIATLFMYTEMAYKGIRAATAGGNGNLKGVQNLSNHYQPRASGNCPP